MPEKLINKAKERHLTTIVRCLILITGLEGLELKSLCLWTFKVFDNEFDNN